MKDLVRRPRAYLYIVALVGAVVICFRSKIDFVLVFGIHHVLNETYSVAAQLKLPERRTGFFNVSRLLLNTLVYATLLNSSPFLSKIPHAWMISSLCVCFVYFLIQAFLQIREIGYSRLIQIVIFETFGFMAAMIMPAESTFLREVIFYHLVFWWVFPIVNNWKGRSDISIKYLASTAVVTAGFYFFMPLYYFGPLTANYIQWLVFAEIFGYFHIASTFGVSKFNPEWIRNRFVRNLALDKS